MFSQSSDSRPGQFNLLTDGRCGHMIVSDCSHVCVSLWHSESKQESIKSSEKRSSELMKSLWERGSLSEFRMRDRVEIKMVCEDMPTFVLTGPFMTQTALFLHIVVQNSMNPWTPFGWLKVFGLAGIHIRLLISGCTLGRINEAVNHWWEDKMVICKWLLSGF